jgi:glycerol-3-phosphate dehydrogenase
LELVGATRHAEPAGTVDAHLIGRYGTHADEVRALIAFDPSLSAPLVDGQPYLRAEAVYAARHEMITTLDDVLVRRTRAHLFDRAATLAAAPAVAELLAAELGWDADETARQLRAYEQLCLAEESAARQTAGADDAHLANATD